MSHAGRTDALTATRELVVLVRLTVGIGDRVLYGEVVDPETRRGHLFRGLTGLSAALRDWIALTSVQHPATRDEEPDRGGRFRTRNDEPPGER